MGIILTLLLLPTLARAEITKTEWIRQLGICESGWRPWIKHIDSNGYYSYGALQFQMSTWLAYGKEFGATKANIYDADLQTKVAISMLDAGETFHWKTCAAKTMKKLGAYPQQ